VTLTKTVGATITVVLGIGWAGISLWLWGWQRSFDITMPLALSLLWLTVFTLACFGAGGFAWRLVIGRPAVSPADLTLTLALGAGVLAACSGILATVGLLMKTPVLLVLATAAAGGGISIHRRWTDLRWPQFPRPHAVLLVAAGAIAILGASSLGVFYDQWNYHLAFPFQWLREGTIITYPRHAYSYFPANMGLLYTYGLATGGGWTAQLIHWWMGALTVGAVGSLAGRFFASSGAVAAIILAATPGVIELAAVAGADLGVAAFFLCAWLAVLRATDSHENSRRWYVLGGIFLGLSVGSKYLAILLLAIPFGLVLPLFSKSMGGRKQTDPSGLTTLLIFTGTAILIWSPWAIRNVIATGDPVYPYLSGFVSSSTMETTDDGEDLADGIGGFGWDPDRLFFAVTLGAFDSGDVGGRVGPVFLWLMPLWLVQLIRRQTSRYERLFASATFLGLLLASLIPSFGRYLIPLLASCAVGCGASFQRLIHRLSKSWATALSTILFVILIGNLNPFPLGHLQRQIGVSVGVIDEEKFLSTYVSHYPAIEYINRELPADAMVYPVAEARSFRIERRLLLEDQIETPLVVEIAESTRSTAQMVERFRTLGVTHILVNQLEARRMAEINHRDDYLVTDDPAARRRIREFFGGALPVVWQNRHLTVFQLPEVSRIE
jgi:4-amino-4-deoxy-L-arabinose transferase-like glycosyltransferase